MPIICFNRLFYLSITMIDTQGFRANVGIVLANTQGQLFWAKRLHDSAWQFPQGGIDAHETPEDALYRELYEEVGLSPHHVKVLGQTKDWLRYRLPERYLREQTPMCYGQKQRWFLLYLDEKYTADIDFTKATPEFDNWRWVSYWYPIGQIVPFKRRVYQQALLELMPFLHHLPSA